MPDRRLGLCLGFIMLCLSGGCKRPAEKVPAEPVPKPDLAYILTTPPSYLAFDLKEVRVTRTAEMTRVVEDWRAHAVQEGWSLMQPSGGYDREDVLACQPAFETHFVNRIHQPSAFEMYPQSLRIGRLDNGIPLGTIIVSLEERKSLVFRDTILFRLDTCEVFLSQPARDRVQLYDGTSQEKARKRLLAEWLNQPAPTEFRINPQRNGAAVFAPQDLVSAYVDILSEEHCRFEDIAGAADRKLTLDEVCPPEAIMITPIEVISQLWLIKFGEDDMEAYLAPENHPYTTLMDASRRPGLQTPYLSEFYSTVLPGPATDVWPRPEDMRAIYPLSPRVPEKK